MQSNKQSIVINIEPLIKELNIMDSVDKYNSLTTKQALINAINKFWKQNEIKCQENI